MKISLFRRIVTEELLDIIFEHIEEYVDDHGDSLELKLVQIEEINEVKVHDVRMNKSVIRIYDAGPTSINFNFILEADLEVYENHRNDVIDELTNQWFYLHCSCDLENIMESFIVSQIDQYKTGMNQNQADYDEDLVPIMASEDYDKYSQQLLNKYYSSAISDDVKVDLSMLAKNAGAKIIERNIDKENTIFGQTYFKKTNARFYDENKEEYFTETIEKDTIVYDPNNFFLRNLGSVSNTIAHEIVHLIFHRKAFLLQGYFDPNLSNISSLVKGGVKNYGINTPVDWMEIQANALAPRVLMPLAPFKLKAFNMIRDYRVALGKDNDIDVYSRVINDLASFYNVSKTAVKIRLLNTGHESVLGVNVFVDGNYVRDHSFKKGSLEFDETFTISRYDAAFQMVANEKLRSLVINGSYAFVENHYVINSPKYIEKNICGSFQLTEYARLHMDECCLIFKIKLDSRDYSSERYFFECVLCRDNNDISYTVVFNGKDDSANNDALKSFNSEIFKVARDMPAVFEDALVYLMEWSDLTVEKLEENSGVNYKKIQRMRNGQKKDPSIEDVIQLSIGMELPPQLSSEFLKRAGLSFQISEQHHAYQHLLNGCYLHTIHECNEILDLLGCETFKVANN